MQCSSWFIWRTQISYFLDDCYVKRGYYHYHALFKKLFALQRGFNVLHSKWTELLIWAQIRVEFETLLCLASPICYCYAGFPYFLASAFYSPAALAIWKTLCVWNIWFSLTSQLAPKQAFSKCFALLHKELCTKQLLWICECANNTQNTKWEIIKGELWICMGRYYQQLNPLFISD